MEAALTEELKQVPIILISDDGQVTTQEILSGKLTLEFINFILLVVRICLRHYSVKCNNMPPFYLVEIVPILLQMAKHFSSFWNTMKITRTNSQKT